MSFGWPLWQVIHHIKPTQGGYQEPKRFQDPSTFGWEKYHITNSWNFWTPCTWTSAFIQLGGFPSNKYIDIIQWISKWTESWKLPSLNFAVIFCHDPVCAHYVHPPSSWKFLELPSLNRKRLYLVYLIRQELRDPGTLEVALKFQNRHR